MKQFILILLLCVVSNQATVSKPESDREHDGFVGPVKKVFAVWTPISESNYPPGSKCRQLTSEYDQTGRITRHSVYPGPCGSDELREDYTYSADGIRTTKYQEIRGANSPPSPPPPAPPAIGPSTASKGDGPARPMVKYDDAGRRIETGMVRPSGKLVYKNAYTYDAKGRLIEVTGFDGENRPTDRRVYAYSGDERVPSAFTYYGRDGKIYEQTTYSEYEFNSQGDWIKRKQTTTRRVSMSYREIEYYADKK